MAKTKSWITIGDQNFKGVLAFASLIIFGSFGHYVIHLDGEWTAERVAIISYVLSTSGGLTGVAFGFFFGSMDRSKDKTD